MGLSFNEERHEYRWNGEVVPSVTSFLKPIYDFSEVPSRYLEEAQQRGTYVHQMTEAYDLGVLDEQANAAVADGAFVGYLAAWKRFLADHEPIWDEIEQMGYCQQHRFAGTWDRCGTLERGRPGRWLIDIKTSQQASRAWGVQTAAYRLIRAERNPMAALDQRGTVQLRPDGTYEFIPWNDPDDLQCFLALLAVRNWSTK